MACVLPKRNKHADIGSVDPQRHHSDDRSNESDGQLVPRAEPGKSLKLTATSTRFISVNGKSFVPSGRNMTRFTYLFASVLVASLSSVGMANNNLFLPGDAFYYAEPEHAWFESLISTDQPIVHYQSPRKDGGRFCGYAGYDELRLENLSPAMRANLIRAYRELRGRYVQNVSSYQEHRLKMRNGRLVPDGDQQSSRHEQNRVSMLIYNRDFDLSKFRPLFRYNENWADAAAAFGHPRDHVAYDFFIDDAQSITNDWRDSALVEPLKFKAPPSTNPQGRLTNQVISVDCKEIQILLFPTSFYEDIAFPTETFQYQRVSGNRANALSESTRAGGMFSIQDLEADNSEPQETEDDLESAEPDTIPYYAYRATSRGAEILRPENERWVTDKQLTPLSCKPEHRKDQEWWKVRHAQKRKEAETSGDARILLIGDSITHGWENHSKVWKETLADEKAFNLGYSGDRTEHVLWRLDNGEVDSLDPEFVILMIGTNNTGHRLEPPADIAAGIQSIISDLKVRLPNATVLLFGVFPRGKTVTDATRINNIRVNELIREFGSQERVNYVDIGNQFFSRDKQLTRGMRADALHLNSDGYAIWAKAIKRKLAEIRSSREPD